MKKWLEFMVWWVLTPLGVGLGGAGLATWVQGESEVDQACVNVLRCVDAGGDYEWCMDLFPKCQQGLEAN